MAKQQLSSLAIDFLKDNHDKKFTAREIATDILDSHLD